MDKTNHDIGTFLDALPQSDRDDMKALDAAISEGLAGDVSPRDLARQIADALDLPKRQVYTRIQELLDTDD